MGDTNGTDKGNGNNNKTDENVSKQSETNHRLVGQIEKENSTAVATDNKERIVDHNFLESKNRVREKLSESASFSMDSFSMKTSGTINNTTGTFCTTNINNAKTTGENLVDTHSSCYYCCCRKKKVDAESIDLMGNRGLLLPEQSISDRNKITLALDLDETLIHSTLYPIPNPDFTFTVATSDGNRIVFFVLVRPGAIDVLEELGNLYEIVIFTSSIKSYADPIIDFLDKNKVIKFRLYREDCTDFDGIYVKDLSNFNRKLEKIIIVDNSSVSYLLQPYNAIFVTTWTGDVNDPELYTLIRFLKDKSHAESVYDILSYSEKQSTKPDGATDGSEN